MRGEYFHFELSIFLVGNIGPGNGPGKHGTNKTIDFGCIPSPVDLGSIFVEFGKIRFLGVVLRNGD